MNSDKHYLRKDVQNEMLRHSQSKEITVRYGDKFGKRPDILKYASDINEHVKNNATSFHVSVEKWHNPMRISTSLKRAELDELRTGWDLLFDIDIPDIKLSKILAYLIINALKDHGIKSISIKFSGNKGFHIGVPFEAFPGKVPITSEKGGVDVKELRYFFPDGLKRISEYLMDYISENYTEKKENFIQFGEYEYPYEKIKEIFPDKKLWKLSCKNCQKPISSIFQDRMIEYSCFNCERTDNKEFSLELQNEEVKCPKCQSVMTKSEYWKGKCQHEIKETFNMSIILEVDRQIFSSRHMYRMVYSLHEKSGLVSIPFNPEKVMKFDKKYAQVDKFKISKHRFMDSSESNPEEGLKLMQLALEHRHRSTIDVRKEKGTYKELEDFSIKIPVELFPPCILNGMKGLKDGRKRFLFAFKNFLILCNYPHEEIEKFMFEWNQKNDDSLKENLIIGQLRYSKQKKEKVLPPNCFYKDKASQGFYTDLGICKPDNFCPRIKNPFNYSKLKTKMSKH